MKNSSGRAWPYAIGASIIFIFGACVATIIVTQQMPVEQSDLYMRNYHDADANANELIKAQIAFDKEYKIKYLSDKLDKDSSVIKYSVTDINSKPVNNAEVTIVVTRPNNHKYDQTLQNPDVKEGLYTFKDVNLSLEGRWDIMAKVNIGELSRYYNIKADTRSKEALEY